MTNGSTSTGGPSIGVVVGSLAAILVGWLVAIGLQAALSEPVLTVKEGFSTFAAFYVVAQALERLLEPVGLWANGPELVQLKAQLKTEETSGVVQQARARFSQLQSNRQIAFFAAASVLATLVSGILGLYLIQGVVDVENAPSWLNAFDVLLTGLVIGAGTKPLHDLVKRIEKGKENADSSTTPAGTTASPPE